MQRNEKSVPPVGKTEAVAMSLHYVAVAFGELQGTRHITDYDNSKIWTRTEGLDQVKIAALAFQSWKAIGDSSAAQDFLFSMMVKRR